MTSSDVLDTCLSVQLTQAADLLLKDLDAVLAALKRRAFEHKYTLTIGRSHGIHAEPTTFGLKLAGHYAEFDRDRDPPAGGARGNRRGAISGAVGTFAHLDPSVEEYVAARLGLRPEPISTQIIPRDRHAAFFATLAVIASGIERLATEVRHLQRSEVREAEEFFHPGQKGSSAMPHKRNPVLSENLTGLARIVRSAVVPALENVTLWHERDISHSSVERAIGPDATVTLDFALMRLAGMMDRLLVYPERMRANLDSLGGVVYSGEVLLALARSGISREDAYAITQRCAMATWTKLGTPEGRDVPREPGGRSGCDGPRLGGGTGRGVRSGAAHAGGGPDFRPGVRRGRLIPQQACPGPRGAGIRVTRCRRSGRVPVQSAA